MKIHQLLVGLSQPEVIIRSTNICSVIKDWVLCQVVGKSYVKM